MCVCIAYKFTIWLNVAVIIHVHIYFFECCWPAIANIHGAIGAVGAPPAFLAISSTCLSVMKQIVAAGQLSYDLTTL